MSAILELLAERMPGIEAERPIYWRSISNACAKAPPLYGQKWYGDLFRDHARDMDWIAQIIILNAKKEADGARQLWAFAGRIEDPSVCDRVQQHAIDEARHSLFYIAMLGLMFPGEFAPEAMEDLRSYAPKFTDPAEPGDNGFATKKAILDEIVQMNIGEIRTLINQMLMRPIIDIYTPEENREKALKLIDSLGDDELRHISYTADIIDEFDDVENAEYYMHVRMDEFNHITSRELNMDRNLALFE